MRGDDIIGQILPTPLFLAPLSDRWGPLPPSRLCKWALGQGRCANKAKPIPCTGCAQSCLFGAPFSDAVTPLCSRVGGREVVLLLMVGRVPSGDWAAMWATPQVVVSYCAGHVFSFSDSQNIFPRPTNRAGKTFSEPSENRYFVILYETSIDVPILRAFSHASFRA